MSDSQSGIIFGPEWKIELEPRSSRTWILRVTNTGSVASSFVPMGLSVASLSPLRHIKRLTLRVLNKSLRLGTPPSTLLNPGEHVDYELWLALDKDHEPKDGEPQELHLILTYLKPYLTLTYLKPSESSNAAQESTVLVLSVERDSLARS